MHFSPRWHHSLNFERERQSNWRLYIVHYSMRTVFFPNLSRNFSVTRSLFHLNVHELPRGVRFYERNIANGLLSNHEKCSGFFSLFFSGCTVVILNHRTFKKRSIGLF